MRKRERLLALLLSLCLVLVSAPLQVKAANPAGVQYCNTYENTGDQRKDILNIALSQMGYTELIRNDTKFGDWGGYPRQPWCANFVSWCARQAEVSQDIIKKSPRARPDYFHVASYPGTEYTPQPGDLFFTRELTHVGFVWYVEGEFFYTVEGNAKFHDYQIPDDPEEDSYYVMSNKRLISDYLFGVPAYEGGGDHTWVKEVSSAHPHKEYYRCTDCGKLYYTGYTGYMADCRDCRTCGCLDMDAGYYIVNSAAENSPVKLRKSHSLSSDHVGYVSAGEVVYAYATFDSWAYVDYDGLRGHLHLQYLTPYMDKPDAPSVEADSDLYHTHTPVKLTWNTPERTEQFRLRLYRDGNLEQDLFLDEEQFTSDTLPAGSYRAEVSACNRTGASAAVTEFTVVDIYTVIYHSHQGADIPLPQRSQGGEMLRVSQQIPQCPGFVFMGWSDTEGGNIVTHIPGQALTQPKDTNLYALWRQEAAVPETLAVSQLPNKTLFMKDDPLDTQGLELELLYTGGVGYRVTEGFAVTGYDPALCDTQTLTVTYEGLQTTYEIRVIDHIPGDMDGNRVVDRDDVMQLLWHITFPELYPLDVPTDLTKDGAVDRDDVMQLLWHITFPQLYPL